VRKSSWFVVITLAVGVAALYVWFALDQLAASGR
jgi:hypothetical protein